MKELENTFNEYRKFVSKMEKDYEKCKVSITEEEIYEEYLDSIKPIKGIGGSIG